MRLDNLTFLAVPVEITPLANNPDSHDEKKKVGRLLGSKIRRRRAESSTLLERHVVGDQPVAGQRPRRLRVGHAPVEGGAADGGRRRWRRRWRRVGRVQDEVVTRAAVLVGVAAVVRQSSMVMESSA